MSFNWHFIGEHGFVLMALHIT